MYQMAFSVGLLGLFPRETCFALGISASGISDEGSAGKSRGWHKFSVFQRVAEKQMVRLSSKGDDLSSLEDDSAKSANFTRESKLHKEKTSYNGEGSFGAMNSRKDSSSEEQGETGAVKSKSANLKFKSTLQDILNDFKSSERPSVAQRKKASSRSGLRSENDSRTAGLKAHRNAFWNLSGQASLDTWKDHAVSEETDLSFDDSSNGVASENVRENVYTMAKSQRFSSVIKSNRPNGKADTGTSTQNGNGPPRRPSRSNGSWSRSSRSSIPGRSLTDSWTSDSKGGASFSSTSTSVSSSSPKQPEALFKPRERIESHDFLELDGENEKHLSSDDFHTATLSSRSSSSASSQESRTQILLQSMGTSSFESLSDLGVEDLENFSFKASSDSVVEDGVESGSFKSPVFLGVTFGTPLPEQLTSNSGVEDDVVYGSPISASDVGSNSMSLPENLTNCSGERVFDSTTFLDSNLDDGTRSMSDNKANRFTPSRAVTKEGTFSSLPASSSRFNHASGVESKNAHDSSPSGLAVSQDSVKTRPVWNHPLSDLPFELQYSYSETPNAPIKGLRWGHQFSPFGLTASGRPWTGCAPLKPSKKKLPEFDSFKPPPRGKKGVKYVQDPGPYPKGQGPQPAKSREEIIGEPLSQEEVVLLVEKCLSDHRQVNLGRDGLTHNMLDVIHSHWKRRRVCKIKCLGVPTVDMDNVCFHVEDKTGGKIIHRAGGVLYLFRGRNYNYKDRPIIPLMLWKPATPIYPKLIEKTPGGLKEEQANQLRALCQKIVPLCKLGKNGIYLNLVKDVKTAFKVDDLVRIDCQGLNASDYRKIGAKLKDLVPCVLLSFENEQILLWKGKAVNASSLVDTECGDVAASAKDKQNFLQEPTSVDGRCMDSRISNTETSFQSNESQSFNYETSSSHAAGESISSAIQGMQLVSHLVDTQAAPDSCYSVAEDTISSTSSNVDASKNPQRVKDAVFEETRDKITGSAEVFLDEENLHEVDILSEHTVLLESLPQIEKDCSVFNSTGKEGEEETVFTDIELRNEGQIETCSAGVDGLWEQAVESGMAIELNETDLDMDSVLKKADELAHIAPPGPAYTRSLVKKLQLRVKERTADTGTVLNFGKTKALMKKKKAAKQVADLHKEEVPQRGGLQLDELAGLLT